MDEYGTTDNKGSTVFVGIIGAVLGFFAGHALGSRLARGVLETAVKAAGDQILRASTGPVMMAMGLQLGTAVLCAVLVPAVTTLVLHHRIKKEESTNVQVPETERKALRNRGSRRDRRRKRSIAARDTDKRLATSGRSDRRVRDGLADYSHTKQQEENGS